MSDFIFSVADIFEGSKGLLFQNRMSHYNIPEYQRGYKWTNLEVTTLLDDIHNFKGNQHDFYCLQNITLVSKADGYFNVVDGQQRLTTLFIILSFLGENELVYDKLTYPLDSIRSKTYEFQNKFILNREIDVYSLSWDKINSLTDEKYNFQDIFYLCAACKAVKDWFQEKEDENSLKRDKFTTKILESVKFIVNNLKDTDEEKVFGNVNSKRIPLDGSDLIRAILITKVAKSKFGYDETDQKLQIRINEERVKIGWELDKMNNWWSRNEVKTYFKNFVSIISKGDIKFDSVRYPINTLYYLYAQTKDSKTLGIQFVEQQEDVKNTYNEINVLHKTMVDWFNDNHIYHYLGYIFSQVSKNTSFEEIYKLWNEEKKTRQAFIEDLKGIIKIGILGKLDEGIEKAEEAKLFYKDKFEEFFPTVNDDEHFLDQKDWYNDKSSQRDLIKILLLLDVIYVTKQVISPPKLTASSFNRSDKDIEHIFPNKPRVRSVDEYKAYIEYLNKYKVDDINSRFNLNKFETLFSNEKYKQSADSFIELFTNDVDLHSIGNLVLLDSSINRSIQNKPYSEKRLRLIQETNKGNFIHPHTFNVFIRSFNDKESTRSLDLEHWTDIDVRNNFISIKEIVTNYFFDEN